MDRMGTAELEHVRRVALALPEIIERISHGVPCFFVRDTRPICYFHDNHGGDGRISLWCPASVGVQDELVGSDPERFFRPPTSASGTFSNWVGVYLDTVTDDADWTEIGAMIEEAFRLVAPQSIIAKLDRR